MWKTLRAQIRKGIYYSLVCRELFPEKPKGCNRVVRGMGDLPYIDQNFLKESKARQKSLAIAWIDFRKFNGMFPRKV